jgi:hypothetical protein
MPNESRNILGGSLFTGAGVTQVDTGRLMKHGDQISVTGGNLIISESIDGEAKLARGIVGIEQLTPELRKLLGLPDSLTTKECPRCLEEKVMPEDDYVCGDCR